MGKEAKLNPQKKKTTGYTINSEEPYAQTQVLVIMGSSDAGEWRAHTDVLPMTQWNTVSWGHTVLGSDIRFRRDQSFRTVP